MMMNGNYLSIILSVCCSLGFNSFGQNSSSYYVEEPRTFYGGIVAGGNFAQVDGDNFAGYHKVGLNAGGIVYAQLADHVAGSLEILYSQKGSRATIAQEVQPGIVVSKYGIDLNYAEVPVMINYFDKRKSHFGAGLSYSRLASSNEYITASDPNYAINPEKYPFKKNDLNILIGGSLHLYKGLFLNARFQYSLIPVRTDIPSGYSRAQQFNNLFAVRLMYLFI